MAVTPSADCPEASCPFDLDSECPAELVGSSGSGCLSACAANVDGNQQDSANCCSGSHNTADTCPPDGVDYYDYFSTLAVFYITSIGRVAYKYRLTEGNCPNAYAYAYDESSGTALFTCGTSFASDYTLTFCP